MQGRVRSGISALAAGLRWRELVFCRARLCPLPARIDPYLVEFRADESIF